MQTSLDKTWSSFGIKQVGLKTIWWQKCNDSRHGHEFQLACQSRLVDCRGLESFMESWPLARERYETDRSLDKVSFDEAEQALKIVVGLIEGQGIFPMEFPTT